MNVLYVFWLLNSICHTNLNVWIKQTTIGKFYTNQDHTFYPTLGSGIIVHYVVTVTCTTILFWINTKYDLKWSSLRTQDICIFAYLRLQLGNAHNSNDSISARKIIQSEGHTISSLKEQQTSTNMQSKRIKVVGSCIHATVIARYHFALSS